MLYEIVKHEQNQVELKITWNEGHSQHISNWMVFLDGTYDYLGDDCGGLVPEPSKKAIEYAIGNINKVRTHRLSINPAVEEGNLTIEYEFYRQKDLDVARDAIADMLLFLQDKLQVMPDYSNIFYEEILVDGFWVDADGLYD